MRTQADQAPSLPLLIGGVVAILLGTSAGCGVIASMREIRQPATGIDFGTAGGTARRGQSDLPGESTRSYEVTVRMNDGSNHVFMDSKPANWNESARQRFLIGVDQVQLSVSAR